VVVGVGVGLLGVVGVDIIEVVVVGVGVGLLGVVGVDIIEVVVVGVGVGPDMGSKATTAIAIAITITAITTMVLEMALLFIIFSKI
jgi:hypothetical protein